MRKTMKKAAGILLAAAVMLGITAPAQRAYAEETADSAITMPVSTDIKDINVHLYAGSMVAQGMVFEGLVNYSPEGPVPALAESWDISEDGKEYTFHIREGVTFTDGEVCDANAIKQNFDAVLNNAEKHAWAVLTTTVDSVEAVDDLTLKLTLKDPYYPTLTELALIRPFRMMSPASFIDGETKDGVSYIAGTGPYILKEHVEDQYAVFEANPDYWAGEPAIKTVTLKVMPAGETTQLAFQTGELNFLFGTYLNGMIDPSAVRALEADPAYQVTFSEPISSRFLLVNCDANRPTGDLNIRQAIWQSVNKEAMCDAILEGIDVPAGKLFDDTMPYCAVELEEKPYDTDAARALIEAAGYAMNDGTGYYEKDGAVLHIQLLYNNSAAANKTLCEYIQANLKDAGIETELVAADKDAVYDMRSAGNYDILLDASWGTPYDPQTCVTGILSNSSYAPAFDELDSYQETCDALNAALISTDEESRQELWTQVLTEMHENAWFIPVSYSRSSIITVPEMQNVCFGDTQYDVPFWKYSF